MIKNTFKIFLLVAALVNLYNTERVTSTRLIRLLKRRLKQPDPNLMPDLEKLVNQLVDQKIDNSKDLKAAASKMTLDSKLCGMLLDKSIDIESYTAILDKKVTPRTWNGTTWDAPWADRRYKAQLIGGLMNKCESQPSVFPSVFPSS